MVSHFMKPLFFGVLYYVLLGGVVVSCQPNQESIERKQGADPFNGPQKTGYLTIDQVEKRVSYEIDGQYAALDQCSRVPLEYISEEPKPEINLTTLEGVQLWPRGVVPFVIEGAPNDFYSLFMQKAIDEYKRAGIQLVPRSNEAHFLKITFMIVGTERCKKNRCDEASGWSWVGYQQTSVDQMNPNQAVNKVVLMCSDQSCPNWSQTSSFGNVAVARATIEESEWLKTYWAWSMNTLLHELGHALGATHEQAHVKAPEFISPISGNNKEFEQPTKKFPEKPISVTNFDIDSVMLYCHSFKAKKSNSSVCSWENEDFPTSLSQGDVMGFQKLYARQIALRVEGKSSPTQPEVVQTQTAKNGAQEMAGKTAATASIANSSSQPQPPPVASSTAQGVVPSAGAVTSTVAVASTAVACVDFPRSPVNEGNNTCSKACREQLEKAGAFLGIAIPSNLENDNAAQNFYNKVRSVGNSRGCDPLRGTKYR